MPRRIVAIANQKGGVGKTASTFHLARAAVREEKRVLLVDADPQGNLTEATAAEPVGEDQAGLADVLTDRTDDTVADVTVPSVWEGCDLVPTSGDTLGIVRDELVIAGAGRESRLRSALASTGETYDLILIDCGPSLDQLTINALSAADAVVVVSQSKQGSANGLARLLGTIAAVRDHYNADLRVGGVLVNQHQGHTISGRTWLAEITAAAEQHNLPLLTPPIPHRVVISDAMEAARGLDEWGSQEATELADMYSQHLTTIMTEGVRR